MGRSANSWRWAGGSRTPRGVRGLADRLTCARGALVSLFPIVERTLGGNADQGIFHFQMIGEFETVVEIAERLLLEFN